MLPKPSFVLTSFTPSGRVKPNACNRVKKTIKSSNLANSSVKRQKRQSAKGFLITPTFLTCLGFCLFASFLWTMSFLLSDFVIL